jgi:hypothetical protein
VIARDSEQRDRPVQDRTPFNVLRRPIRLPPMRKIKDVETEDVCACTKPIRFHHRDGSVSCVRCRCEVLEEVEE